MSASLGTKTYTSVVWASGDYITEAKMDNMVENDQAYDSHEDQGLLLANEKSLAARKADDSIINLLRLNSSDQLEIGDTGLGVNPIDFLEDQWIKQKDFGASALPLIIDSLEGSDFTTSSASLVDVTGVSITFTASVPGYLLCIANAEVSNDTANSGVRLAFDIDGTDYGSKQHAITTADEHNVVTNMHVENISDGSITVKLRAARYPSGTAKLYTGSCDLIVLFIPYYNV